MKLLICLFIIGSLLPIAKADSPLCQICTVIVGAVEEALEDDQNSIDEIGKDVCDKLFKGDFWKELVCKTVVDGAVSQAEEDIKNKEKPQIICAKIHLC
uniref:Saposin B-type domain-containing protein n=1 Tax=Steinernema glaseri TaxID=37863 RepID=A0A1I8ATX5_9BILA